MPTYTVTDVKCGSCKKSINEPSNWVYQGGLKLMCPDCAITYKWPYRVDVKVECIKCGKIPDFVTGTNANQPMLYCRKCVADDAVGKLQEIANRTDASPSTYMWLGIFGVVLALVLSAVSYYFFRESMISYSMRRPSDSQAMYGTICGALGLLFIIPSVFAIFARNNLARGENERIARERSLALEVLNRITGQSLGIEQILDVFGLVPGYPFRTDYIDYALKSAQNKCQFCGKTLLVGKGVILTGFKGVTQSAQQMLARRCDCVNCGAFFCLECGNAEGYKQETGATHCPKCGTQVPMEHLI